MSQIPRILFVAPDEAALESFRRVVLPGVNILAVEGNRFPTEELVDFARASDVGVIIARAGRVEWLRKVQYDIPVVELTVTGADMLQALEQAGNISRDVAVVAHRSMLAGVERLADILGIRLRLVHSFEPESLLDGIFLALERKAKVIIGDAPVLHACRENNIPCVLVPVSDEAIRYSMEQALELGECIARHRETRLAVSENMGPPSVAPALFKLEDIMGHSAAIIHARERAARYAAADAAVLLTGETGVGKELFAQSIHASGARRAEPFVAVNMPSIPASLVESELFGYVRGAFTDARREGKPGMFSLAGHGTLFLDEVAEVAPDIQARLLRVLQNGTFTRLGDTKTRTANCRIIAATNRSLEEEVSAGRFRADLYYRLNVLPLPIPPLRERQEDIPYLVSGLLSLLATRYCTSVPVVERGALRLIMAHRWPGNVRELEALLERLIVLGHTDVIREETVRQELGAADEGQMASPSWRLSGDRIRAELAACNGNQSLAAARLGIHRSTLWRRLKEDSQSG